METSTRIREARKEAGITQKELAQRLGVTQQNLAQYENGKRSPKYGTLTKIAAALDVNVLSLMDEKSFMNMFSERYEACNYYLGSLGCSIFYSKDKDSGVVQYAGKSFQLSGSAIYDLYDDIEEYSLRLINHLIAQELEK